MSIGILGYGKLGKALRNYLEKSGEEVLVFSDREKERRREGNTDFSPSTSLLDEKLPLDALFLAHGSFGTYKEEALLLSQKYDLISAFDIHCELPSLQTQIHESAKQYKTTSILGVGWDPGLLSLARIMTQATFPELSPKTAWGEGVSEGHSFAIRQIVGVEDAIQYTVPDGDWHHRVCYVVCKESERARIRAEILNMREYFVKEHTEVHFISKAEFDNKHSGNAFHRGKVSASLPDGSAGMSFEVSMKCNPDFTARTMCAYLPALLRLKKEGKYGAYGPLDIPFSYLFSDAQKYW